MLLQVPPQLDLGAVLAHRPVVHQQEMGMQVVEHVQFAERVQQRLVRSHDLQRGRQSSVKRTRTTSFYKNINREVIKYLGIIFDNNKADYEGCVLRLCR